VYKAGDGNMRTYLHHAITIQPVLQNAERKPPLCKLKILLFVGWLLELYCCKLVVD